MQVLLISITDDGWFATHSNYVDKTTYIIAINKGMNMPTIFLERRQKVRKVGKKSDLFYFTKFCCVIFQSQRMVIQPYGV
jgi:hypothetical protein